MDKVVRYMRLSATSLGVAASLVSANDCYGALCLAAPVVVAVIHAAAALCQFGASIGFWAVPSAASDRAFLLIFATFGLFNLDRLLVLPVARGPLVTVLAFAVGLAAVWINRRSGIGKPTD